MSSRRIVAVLLLLLQAQGCMVWRPTKLTPEEVAQNESEIRVKLTDASEVDVHDPWVRDDSLGGARLILRLDAGRLDRSQPIPLDSVAVIETRDFSDPVKLVAYMIAIPVVVVGGVVYLIAASSGSLGPLCNPCPSPL